MPDLSSNATALRASGYKINLWAAFFAGTSVYTANITAVDNDYTVAELTISGGVGIFANVKRGMEVRIYNSSAEYKGSVRVRRAGTLSTSNIPISETAQGFVDIIAGDTLSVVDDHRLRSVFPEASETFKPDKEAYTNQTEVYAPVAHSGGAYASRVDTGQSYATVNFYGASSYALDPDSGGTLTHSWTFPATAAPTSSTSADPSGVQIPVGEWVIEHTVTDTSNSKTYTQSVPCIVFNDASPPYRVKADSVQLSGTENDGWEASFELVQSEGLDDIPDGAWVILFAEETINGTIQSFGNINSGRSSIKFVGILQRDTVSHTGASGEQTLGFSAVSPILKLREMAGFSQYFDSKTTANTWQELGELSTKIVILHLLRTYTTLFDMVDVYYQADDYPYPKLSFQKATPYEQVMEIIDGIESRLACDRTCNLMIQKYPEFYEIADRASLTTAFTFTERDVKALSLERTHTEPVRILEGRAFISSGIELGGIFARWPSLTPGEGSQDSVIDWMLVVDQDDLNTKTGLHGGKLNRVFIDTDGAKQHAPRLLFESRNDVWDFYQEWLATTLDATTNWREVDLSAFRWILRQINVTYSNHTAQVRLTLDAETAAPSAQTYFPPEEDDLQFPEIDIPPIEMIPPADPGPFPYPILTEDNGEAVILGENAGFAVTSNFDDAVPSWATNDHSGTITETIRAMAWDYGSAYFTSGTGALGAYLATSNFIYHVDDVFSATPTINLLHTFSFSSSSKQMAADSVFSPGNNIVITFVQTLGNTYAAYSTDGTSFTEVVITTTTNTSYTPRLHYSTATANTIYAFVEDDWTGGTASDGITPFVSTTAGASWTEVDATHTLVVDRPRAFYFPFRGGGNQIAYYSEHIDTNNGNIVVGNFNTPAQNVLDLSDSRGVWGVRASNQYGFTMPPTKNKLLAMMLNTDISPDLNEIWYSTNYLSLTPTFTPLSGTAVAGNLLQGFLSNEDGTRLVLWRSQDIWIWEKTNPGLVQKGPHSIATSVGAWVK